MGRMLRRAFATGFRKFWWLPTLLLMPVIGLLSAAALSLLGIETPEWNAPTVVTALLTGLTILFIGGGLEEFGWRGYALDRMQTGKNAVSRVAACIHEETRGTLDANLRHHDA